MSDMTELLMSALERQSRIQAQQFDDLRSSIATLRRQVADLVVRVDRLDDRLDDRCEPRDEGSGQLSN